MGAEEGARIPDMVKILILFNFEIQPPSPRRGPKGGDPEGWGSQFGGPWPRPAATIPREDLPREKKTKMEWEGKKERNCGRSGGRVRGGGGKRPKPNDFWGSNPVFGTSLF